MCFLYNAHQVFAYKMFVFLKKISVERKLMRHAVNYFCLFPSLLKYRINFYIVIKILCLAIMSARKIAAKQYLIYAT